MKEERKLAFFRKTHSLSPFKTCSWEMKGSEWHGQEVSKLKTRLVNVNVATFISRDSPGCMANTAAR